MQRLIDIPLESLPAIDEHGVEVRSSPQDAWEAALAAIEAAGRSRLARTLARAHGCEPAGSDGDVRRIGSTIPGFVVVREIPPAAIALMGKHRFARYALVFRIDVLPEDPEGHCRVRAETRAEFPGKAGRVYRALVIHTGLHVLALRRALRTVRHRAERG